MAEPQNTSIDSEIDLGQLLAKIWQGKVTIAWVSFLALLVGLFYIADTPPTYQADSLLQLEERSNQLALPAAMQGLVDSSPQSATEIEIIRSRMVLGRVVADLNLDWIVEPAMAPLIGTILSRYNLPIPELSYLQPYARVGESMELSLLSVPPQWFNTALILTVTEDGFSLLLPDDRTLSGEIGTTISLEDSNFAISINAMNAPVGRQYSITQIDERSAIDAIRNNLSVSERSRSSGILELRYTGPSRQQNVRVLNAIGQSYLLQNISRSAAEAESGLEFINQQLPQAEQTLRQAEQEMNDFRQQQESVDLTFETQNILTQISTLENQLADLQRQEDEISQRYTPSHPVYRQLLDERERLQSRLGELRASAGELPQTQREILNLTRNVEMAQRVYTDLLTRQQEVEVLRASTVGNVRILDSAAAGRGPIAPRRSIIMALALILGIMLGIAIVFLRSWLNKGVQETAQIEALGLPVFATINYSPSADSLNKRSGKLDILALSNPTDLAVEAFRSLRTSLHFGMLDAESPTLAITSAHPAAGKSFVSVNLAVIAAQAGSRVCIVDADLRRGQLRRYFGVERNQPGLANILAGDATLEECLLQGPLPELFFLPTGKYPPNPSELLMRATLATQIEHLSQNFDLTIFDCPPVLAVTDPVILSRAVGASIFVARHNITPVGEIDAAIKALEAGGSKFNGAIMNGFDPKKAKAGYGYGYSYRYQYEQRKD